MTEPVSKVTVGHWREAISIKSNDIIMIYVSQSISEIWSLLLADMGQLRLDQLQLYDLFSITISITPQLLLLNCNYNYKTNN
jgi:hypothetical protein